MGEENNVKHTMTMEVYKTAVRPAMMYGAETWAVKKAQEKKLDVAEIRMLTCTSGVTKLDRMVEVVWACIEKRRRIRRQESDGDGGAGEKKERKTKSEVVG